MGVNELDTVAMVGYAAAVVSTFVFVPQVVRTWRLRSARDLSLATIIMMIAIILVDNIYYRLRNAAPGFLFYYSLIT